jgi:hypothetical protein
MASVQSSDLVHYEGYVAGWLDTSIHDFLARIPGKSGRAAFALITCLDSDPNPAAILKKDSQLRALLNGVKILRNALLVPSRLLEQQNVRDTLFSGFDEVWFFRSETVKPKPNATSIVGPNRIDQSKLDLLGPWLDANQCSLALGDGCGLNLIVKAHGLVREVVAKSLYQPEWSELHPSWIEDEEKKTPAR